WIVRVHAEVDCASVLTAGQDVLPALATITRAEDAALLIRTVRMAQRSHVDEVGVIRVDADLTNVSRIGESEVAPRLATVRRSVHTIAVRDVATDIGLAHADIHDVGIGRRAGGPPN